MKPNDQSLRRLLEGAAKAPPEAIGTAPWGLETRVLAHWRAARAEDDSAFLFAFLCRATLSASLVLVLSAAWSLTRPSASLAGDEAAFLDHEIQTSLSP